MSAFLFQIELPVLSEDIAELIPAQRKHIDRLMATGQMLSYSVSMSGDHIWCVIDAEEEKEAMELIAGFPLRKYFADVCCHPLLLHNAVPAASFGLSLN